MLKKQVRGALAEKYALVQNEWPANQIPVVFFSYMPIIRLKFIFEY